jgi:homoserine kinase type II
MSVYTLVERHQLEEFLTHYHLGTLISHEGISAGIENTNYFVTTTIGQFVLTLFEQYPATELPYFLELMAYIAEHEVPCAHPIPNVEGHYLQLLNNKPAAIVERLCGKGVEHPTLIQCQALGTALGCFHLISPDFPQFRQNDRGPHWWKITATRVLPYLNAKDKTLLQAEMHFQTQHRQLNLPRGVIHADLFRDNALFNKDKLCGIIDFYYACNDVLIYDIAVAINDWCSLPDGSLDAERVQMIMASYNAQRPLTPLESKALPIMLRAAALRFWLSRLQDLHFPRQGEMTHIKNPLEFRNILQFHVNRWEI